jgi:hypothetical protein
MEKGHDMADPRDNFYYKRNYDGTSDAICLKCFLTAAKNVTAADVSKLEITHSCAGKMGIVDGKKKKSVEPDRHLLLLLAKLIRWSPW